MSAATLALLRAEPARLLRLGLDNDAETRPKLLGDPVTRRFTEGLDVILQPLLDVVISQVDLEGLLPDRVVEVDDVADLPRQQHVADLGRTHPNRCILQLRQLPCCHNHRHIRFRCVRYQICHFSPVPELCTYETIISESSL